MEAHRSTTTVGENGEVALHGVPFRPGEEVEVIVLRSAATPAEETPESGTAGDLAHSKIVGLWKDRDLPDSPEYARQLREEAWRRPHIEEELKKLHLGDDAA